MCVSCGLQLKTKPSESHYPNDTIGHAIIFIAALFKIVKCRNNPNVHQLKSGHIKSLSGILYSNKNILTIPTRINLTNIMLNEKV